MTLPAIYKDKTITSTVTASPRPTSGPIWPRTVVLLAGAGATGGSPAPVTSATPIQPQASFVGNPSTAVVCANSTPVVVGLAFVITSPNSGIPIPAANVVVAVSGGTASPVVGDGTGNFTTTVTLTANPGTTTTAGVSIQASDQVGQFSNVINLSIVATGVNTNGPVNYIDFPANTASPLGTTFTPYALGTLSNVITSMAGKSLTAIGCISPSDLTSSIYGKTFSFGWSIDGTVQGATLAWNALGGDPTTVLAPTWVTQITFPATLGAGTHTVIQQLTVNGLLSASAPQTINILPSNYSAPTIGDLSVVAWSGQYSVLRLLAATLPNDIATIAITVDSGTPNWMNWSTAWQMTLGPSQMAYSPGFQGVCVYKSGVSGAGIPLVDHVASPLTAGTVQFIPPAIIAGTYATLDLATAPIDAGCFSGSHTVTVTLTDAAGKTTSITKILTFPSPTMDNSRFSLTTTVSYGLGSTPYIAGTSTTYDQYGGAHTTNISYTNPIKIPAMGGNLLVIFCPDGFPQVPWLPGNSIPSSTDLIAGLQIAFPTATGWASNTGYQSYVNKYPLGPNTAVIDLRNIFNPAGSAQMSIVNPDATLATGGKQFNYGVWQWGAAALPKAATLAAGITQSYPWPMNVLSMVPETQAGISKVDLMIGSTVIGTAVPASGSFYPYTQTSQSAWTSNNPIAPGQSVNTPLNNVYPFTAYNIPVAGFAFNPSALDLSGTQGTMTIRVTCSDGSTTTTPTNAYSTTPGNPFYAPGGIPDGSQYLRIPYLPTGCTTTTQTGPFTQSVVNPTVGTINITSGAGTKTYPHVSMTAASLTNYTGTPGGIGFTWPTFAAAGITETCAQLMEVAWPSTVMVLSGGATPGIWTNPSTPGTSGFFTNIGAQGLLCCQPGRYLVRFQQNGTFDGTHYRIYYADVVIDIT